MFSLTKIKIRAIIQDPLKTDSEIHEYTTSLIFTLEEPNVVALVTTTIDGDALESGETATYSATTNKVTLAGVSLTSGAKIEFTFTYYEKYSETELKDWVIASLVYVSLYGECKDFELETDGDDAYNFEPTPSNKELDMIALVAGILINPDWSEYKLPNITLKFPRTQDKETRIGKLIYSLQSSGGYTGLIDLEG